ncbi:MAG: patatin-like phospholipase family protein [Gemmatimonadota bacterium]
MTSGTESNPAASDAVEATRLFAGLAPESRAAVALRTSLRTLMPGERLFSPGSGAAALYMLHKGLLHATEPDPPGEPRLMRLIGPGEVLDGLQELGGNRSIAVFAVDRSEVAVIEDAEADRLVAALGDVRAAVRRMHRRQSLTSLRRIFGPLEEKLLDDLESLGDWVHLPRGEVLFEPSGASDGLFFIIRGRIAALTVLESGEEEVQSYRTRSETVGEAGFLTGRPRSYKARAVRDSILVRYTSAAFEQLIARHPHVVRYITRAIALRSSAPLRTARTASVTTIAFAPAGQRSRFRELAERLTRELATHGSLLFLDAARLDAMTGVAGLAQTAEGGPNEQRLLAFLERCEAEHRLVAYVADGTASQWSRRCARHADRLVLVAEARELHSPSRFEEEILLGAQRGPDLRATLVLVHPDGSKAPSGTSYWLDARPYVADHHHIRWTEQADIARIARIVSGRSFGLVLGGGGARGFAHIGLLRAMLELGVPVDMVGGTSMGALVGGQFAIGRTPEEITTVCRRVFLGIKPHRGFNLPLLSLVGRARMELAGRAGYGDVEIEDLWLNYFCVSANLTTADVVVHRKGLLRDAALASANLPGIGVPMLHNRNLLVDGGILNNLPTDVMRRAGCATIVASVVSAQVTETFTCDRIPAVWEVLRGRFGGVRPRFPSIVEVVMRATGLSSSKREAQSAQDADIVVRPGIARFGLLAFESIDEIISEGHTSGRETLARFGDAASENHWQTRGGH